MHLFTERCKHSDARVCPKTCQCRQKKKRHCEYVVRDVKRQREKARKSRRAWWKGRYRGRSRGRGWAKARARASGTDWQSIVCWLRVLLSEIATRRTSRASIQNRCVYSKSLLSWNLGDVTWTFLSLFLCPMQSSVRLEWPRAQKNLAHFVPMTQLFNGRI